MVLPSAVQSSRTDSSSLLITRPSVLISQVPRVQIPCLRLMSAPGISALSAAKGLTELVIASEVVSYTTRAHRLPPPALLLHPQRRLARYSRSTKFPLS